MVNFVQSIYKYTDPIRYFKANDPYYYQVDNIPLKQLQENCNFLKSQLEALNSSEAGTSRKEFTELQPYAQGVTNEVKVRPGRYTARINDGYKLNAMQFLTQVGGFSVNHVPNGLNTYSFLTNAHQTMVDILNKFKSKFAENATLMNGLFEQYYVFGFSDNDLPVSGLPNSDYTRSLGRTIAYNTSVSSIQHHDGTLSSYKDTNTGIESEFIKKWRGIARTSIVDIPSELSIEIPAFDAENDFFYYDESGAKVNIQANHRIDLLFIYSKPIDVSSTTIAKFNSSTNNPTTILSPTLGLVRGAGVGIKLGPNTSTGEASHVVVTDTEGGRMIIPNPSDELAPNTGLNGIKGSFPSPDDLMNFTPIISENLESDDYRLIGQSILPIAYIVVRRDAVQNLAGNVIIEDTDVIDIRPFFRTTELSYNERAGIAAATPPITISNPAATELYVDSAVIGLRENARAERTNLETKILELPRIIATGSVLGGWSFGPESTLYHFVSQNKQTLIGETATQVEIENYIATRYYGFENGSRIPQVSQWDKGFNNGSLRINNYDSPNIYYNQAQRVKSPTAYYTVNTTGGVWNWGVLRQRTEFGSHEMLTENNLAHYGWGYHPNVPSSVLIYAGTINGVYATGTSLEKNATRNFCGHGNYNYETGGKYNFGYVKKTFTLDGMPSWVNDIDVNVRYLNCSPLTSVEEHDWESASLVSFQRNLHAAKAAASIGGNIWTTKGKTDNGKFYFTIYVGFSCNSAAIGGQNLDVSRVIKTWDNMASYGGNSFAVIVDGMSKLEDDVYDRMFTDSRGVGSEPRITGCSHVGVAALPSISFDVVGYPGTSNNITYQSDGNSTITIN